MREIKIRAWVKDEDVMKNSHSNNGNIFISFRGNYHSILSNCVDRRKRIFVQEPPDNVILMQYIGFNDKNGNEIYMHENKALLK